MEDVLIYHQCGFNESWNIQSYVDDGVGEGFILSPVNMKKDKMDKLDSKYKKVSFFDPQFYVPRSTKSNLNTYNFFPNNIANGYETMDYEEFATKSAKMCVDFQIENDFRYILIPWIYQKDILPNYYEVQKSLYIEPFLNELGQRDCKKKVLLSVIVKDSQVNDETLKNELLNFITSFTEIDGVYLIPEHKESYKRVRDNNYIYNLMMFIHVLRENSLYVHLAYTDIEGLLFTLADVNSLSIGSYENLRCFNSVKFEEQPKKVQQGPTPRIYCAKLLQWLDYNYLPALKRNYPTYLDLIDETSYRISMFSPSFHWHFTKPEIYKHYFLSYSQQIKSLPDNYDDRYGKLVMDIENAIQYYEEIQKKGIYFDDNSNGAHLPNWLTAINDFNNNR